ncbi:MAG: hypothetical protein IMF12_09075, partial [Proteobacteria bacterium]|nr:hypothetical protein [Pseudomonadota bacterium]
YDPTDEFMLTVTKTNPQGIIKANVPSATLSCPGGCTEASYQYTSGDTVTITAKSPTGFTFTGWTGDCNSTDNRLKILIDSAKNCTANFERDDTVDMYELKIVPIGTGKGIVTQSTLINCGDSCSALYIKDKTVWLKPESSPLSKFIGWGGDCTKNKVTITKDMTCTANFQSDLELVAQEMIDAFYATAKLADGSSVAEAYPRSTNEARLKEAFWLATTAIMQTELYLTTSKSQSWPSQFNGIEWLPADADVDYTHSIKIADQFVNIEVGLLATDGTIANVGIITYYSEETPTVDDGSSWITSSVYFSRYYFRLW